MCSCLLGYRLPVYFGWLSVYIDLIGMYIYAYNLLQMSQLCGSLTSSVVVKWCYVVFNNLMVVLTLLQSILV